MVDEKSVIHPTQPPACIPATGLTQNNKEAPTNRRNPFTAAAALFAVIGLAGCKDEKAGSEQAAAEPAQSFQWKMVTAWPKNYPGLGTAAERLAERVKTLSAGRLTIKVYAGGELVPPLEGFG